MSEWDYPNKAVEQRQAEIDYLRDKEAEIERLREQMIESAKRYRRNIDEITKERDAIRTRLERVKEWALKREDESVNQLWKILDGEEVKKHGVC